MKFLGIILLVLVLWIAAPAFLINYFPSWEVRGQFGDLFGSVNALFSGFAFAGLLYTITLQRNELAMQREELKLQREEMIAAREELASQGAVQKKQYQLSIVNLKVQVANMEIEALKVESEKYTPSAKAKFSERIREQTEISKTLISELENG